MACDFKPGDEVVCVDDRPCFRGFAGPVKGRVYLVDGYDESRFAGVGLLIAGLAIAYDFDGKSIGWAPERFRKVQKRDSSLSIETFLTIKPGFEEPRKTTTPARKRERV